MLYELIERTIVAQLFYHATIHNYINCSIRHIHFISIMSSKKKQEPHFSLNSPIITVSKEVIHIKIVLIISFSNTFRTLHFPVEVQVGLINQ
jgi:hypothetical protein